jgi:penicillin-binding protein 1A
MDRQRSVLNRMIEFGYTTAEEAEASFKDYWDNYDYTRESTSAYYHREDAAPWFSEYVRRELDGMMYGAMDYYRDGYTVLTTLDLKHQAAAEKLMAEGLVKANREYAVSRGTRLVRAEQTYIPIVDLLSLAFNLNSIHATSDAQNEQKARSRYTKTINPVVDMAALAFGLPDLKVLTNASFAALKNTAEQNVVEGALIAIENETGYIKALVGGSRYDESNQLIRATQGRVMPGSSFKPLYYSAAIDSRLFTAASQIYDIPIVFHNEDGTPYIPLNFRGEWKGSVLLYDALAQSMNVPSLKVLDAIGFDAAIDRASALLGITDPREKERTFPRVYPMGLGIISISPVQMARAFAIFANQGREVTPIAIRSVEDRNGKVVLDPERELRQRERRLGSDIQVISPQNAYIMTSLLKKTVETGTLRSGSGFGSKFTYRDEEGNRYRIAAAGKTGTTQNWSDAWTVGFTPYFTTAVWFGFDKPGNSLGLSLTGATLAGPVWGDFMRELNMGLPARDFIRPSTGIVDVTVCAQSGQLKTSACNEGEVTLPFLAGTQPRESCTLHGGVNLRTAMVMGNTVRTGTLTFNDEGLLGNLAMPQLPIDLSQIPSRLRTVEINPREGEPAVPQPAVRQDPARRPQASRSDGSSPGNALLDGDAGTIRPGPPAGDIQERPAPDDPAEPADSAAPAGPVPEGGGISGEGTRPLDYNPLME